MEDHTSQPALRTGFTTGACATAAASASCRALLTGRWMTPVRIVLPRGQSPRFPLEIMETGTGWARAAVRKDAGDDPDVTHNALIIATVRHGLSGTGITFVAGSGVGTATKPGLPIAVGEPAINPVPRKMMSDSLKSIAAECGAEPDFEIEIAVPGGKEIAIQTWNPRLGIEAGISILGTTGIVKPYSCSAWIASIHRGIDVARASGARHVVGSTGSVSEASAQRRYNLPDWAMLDMGDFVGGMLKYIRIHPVPMLTIAGGFGKLTKLAQGAIDLHSKRSQVDFGKLARLAENVEERNRPEIRAKIETANTASEALGISGAPLAKAIAQDALVNVEKILRQAPVAVEILIYNRSGDLVSGARSDSFSSVFLQQ